MVVLVLISFLSNIALVHLVCPQEGLSKFKSFENCSNVGRELVEADCLEVVGHFVTYYGSDDQ